MIDEDIELRKPEKFDERFDEYLARGMTRFEAYVATERDYRRVFGEDKYKTFKSFDNSWYERLKCRLQRTDISG